MVKNSTRRKKQKTQQEFIINVLERALTRSKDKTASRTNVGKATYLLTGYKMTVGEVRDAIKVGEEYVRDKENPRGPSADVALVVSTSIVKVNPRRKR